MSLAIERFIGQGDDPSEELIVSFLREHQFPIIEGHNATFVFYGQADEVFFRHWIFSLESSRALQRLGGTDFWYLTEQVPPGSRVEYKFEVHKKEGRSLIRDPLNQNLAMDPFGANSVCQGEGYEVPEWASPNEETRSGRLVDLEIESSVFGDRREVTLYLPARMRPSRRYPLIVAHDGIDYLRFASLQPILDNLIHRLEIPQVIVALTQSRNRMGEYAADPRHARFIAEELVPEVESRYPLLPDPASRCLMGASFGAVASFATAWTYPGQFGRLLLQSGSFAFTDIGESFRGPAFAPIVEFMNQVRETPGRPSEKVFLSCGVYESLIYENRSFLPVLQRSGMDVRFVESRDGHNWENWRDRLREGLSWLFPGPLWMVYE